MSSRFDLKSLLLTAGLATLATSAAAALLGKRQKGKAAAPLNATSHIVWGKEAFRRTEPDLKHTAVGAALNASAMLAWAGMQQLMFGGARGTVVRAAAAGASTAALAYATDYHLVPERFTPGFERHLSKGAMAAVYGVLAAALAIGLSRQPR